MDFIECVTGRRSVRKFTAKAIDEAALKRIIKAASHAPSWKNSQTTRYIVITDATLKNYLAENCMMGFGGNKMIIQYVYMMGKYIRQKY